VSLEVEATAFTSTWISVGSSAKVKWQHFKDVVGATMRILYAVHGYGRGHATRTLAVLPDLARRWPLLCLAGGDAYAAMWSDFPVVRIPTLRFSYVPGSGRVSTWQTLRRNLPALLDLVCRGPVFETVREIVRDFGPDVIISDAEVWSHRVAADLRIPRISFDHIGLMSYCEPEVEWFDRPAACFDAQCYRWLMGRPDRVLVSSFYAVPPRRPDVKVVGPLLRQAVREQSPREGDYLLAYFNQGKDQLRPALLEALAGAGVPVHLYGSTRRGQEGPLRYLPFSNLPFLEDLAGCRAVISTAGNQLIGEAIFLGKPVCVFPEACVEQRLNAAAVERLGIGMRLSDRQFTTQRLRAFLANLDRYKENLARNVHDGLQESLEAIDQFLAELAPAASRAVRPLPVASRS
jgi:uncharacterized protein (TIGR00661 family)